MQLREAIPADAAACVALFTASVHQLAARHYNGEQRLAWAPPHADMTFWQQHLAGLEVLLAEREQSLLGFIGYAADGHIDLLFCAPQAAREGVASALYTTAEKRLRALGQTRLYTEASLLAKPFFLNRGFAVIEQEDVQRGDVSLRRYHMQKMLD